MADLNIGNSSASVVVNTKHNGSVIPQINNTHDLGTSELRWKNIYGGTFIGSLNGNAATATKLATAQSITLTGDTTGTASSQAGWSIGTTTSKLSNAGHLDTAEKLDAFIEVNKLKYATVARVGGVASDGMIISVPWLNSSWGHQIFLDDSAMVMQHRHKYTKTNSDGSKVQAWSGWATLVDSNNYTNYTVTKTGSGASGTWGINITGNAATATDADKIDGLHATDLTKIYKYTVPVGAGVRIRYPAYCPCLVTACGSNGGAQLILLGTGYGHHGTGRNTWTELVSCSESMFTWSLPEVDEISCSIEIMNHRDSSSEITVWANSTIGFTAITALTSPKQNHVLLHSNNYTNYTVTKTGRGASGTWGISVSGNAATASKVNNKLTVGSKTYDGSAAVSIVASDLGLASAMLFLGTTTTAIKDGATTNPVAISGSNKTVTAGNVVLYGSKEFVWTGSAWEELGNEGSYKIVQAAVADPSASGTSNTFIDTISQDTNGKITATKKTVAVTNSAPTLAWGTTSTIGTVAGTNLQVKMPANPNTDTKVTQTVTTSNAAYPLLLAPSGQTATTTTISYFDSGVTLNPSTNTIAANISGNAATATISRSLGSNDTMKIYAQSSNEVNFGGTSNLNTIYFGYRAVDSKPIPSKFIFGGDGTAELIAAKFTGTLNGNAATATNVAWSGITNKPSYYDIPKYTNTMGYYASSDTHILKLGYWNCTYSFDNLTLLVSSSFWGNQHGSTDIITLRQDLNDNASGSVKCSCNRVTLMNSNRTFYYNIDQTNRRVYLYVYVTGGNSYGKWNTSVLQSDGGSWVSEFSPNQPNQSSFVTISEITAAAADTSNYLNINNSANCSHGLQYMQHYSQTSGNDLPSNTWWHIIKMNHGNGDTYYKRLLAFDFWNDNIMTSGAAENGKTRAWKQVWVQGNSVTGAVWNDYAEYREADTIQGGRCVREVGDDTLTLTTKRLMRGCSITSDTWGFAQGETDKAKTPIAVAGRVLAYPLEDRELFKEYIGYSVCSGPDGTVSLMTEEEELKYPWAIVGTVSAVPDYEEWGGGEMADRPSVKVDGRIWIKVR